MIVLDTNVVSELIKPMPDGIVRAWFRTAVPDELFITAVTVAEARTGVELMPDGRRKGDLRSRFERLLKETFGEFVLAFDAHAAEEYALLMASRSRSGRPITSLDAQIAAICRQHNATLATRNTEDFEGVGIDVVNPWEA